MVGSLLKLVRFPLILTAVADSATGAILVYQLNAISRARQPEEIGIGLAVVGSWVVLAWLAGASAFLYCAGMTLNDVADAGRDRELHPDRPIPSGMVKCEVAFFLGEVLIPDNPSHSLDESPGQGAFL